MPETHSGLHPCIDGNVADPVEAAFEQAMRHQLRGQVEQAERLYGSILHSHPGHALANHCLGMLKVQLRRPAEGLPYLNRAIQTEPGNSDFWLGFLETLLVLEDLTAVRTALDRARNNGLHGPACDDFAQRVAARETAFSRPEPSPAAHELRAVTDSEVRRAEADLLALIAEHRMDEAGNCARSLTSRFPDEGVGWKYLGAILWIGGHAEEALAAMREAVRLMPRDAEALSNFGSALAKSDRCAEAEKWLLDAISAEPAFSGAYHRLGMTYELQGRYEEAEAAFRRAISLQVGLPNVEDERGFSALLFLMGYNARIDPETFISEHRRYGELFESDCMGHWPRHANSPVSDRQLRIGFVSGDLHDHPVSTFLEPVLAQLARSSELQIHVYSNHSLSDRVTAQLREHVDCWNAVWDFSHAELVQKIMDDQIDILIDLSGHTARNRLPVFARKPAPVQASWLGYPATTGLSAMDYYLADDKWLPPGEFDRLFTEKLAYLPNRWAFVRHPEAPAVGMLPALGGSPFTFGSFHRTRKLNEFTLRLWSELLLALPDSRLMVAGADTDESQRVLMARFASLGIGSDRLLLKPRSSMSTYLGLHNEVDVALDTHPYCGATTSMHSLSMGVPILTLAGPTAASRACAGILKHVGLDGFIASDPADFVAKGIEWASRFDQLTQIRRELRSRLESSAGCRPELIASRFTAAMRHMWRQWCARIPPQTFHAGDR